MPDLTFTAPPRRARAFTLVELLVATSVTLLLVVVLVQVFNGAALTWRRSEAQVDAYREARGALQLMARDLSATLQASYAQATGSGAGAPTAGPAVPTLALQRRATSPDSDGPNNEEVYCLTNIPNGGSSSLCTVGYFCQWMPAHSNSKVPPHAFALMRQYLDSNATFQRLKTAGGGTTPMTFNSLFAPSTTTPPTQLAAYIWDLRFRIDTDLNEQTVADGNATPSPLDHSSPTPLHYNADDPPFPPRLPPYIEIRFKALSDVAARRLEATDSPVSPATWQDTGGSSDPLYKQIILPNCQQFVLRVPLTNATPLPTPTPAPGP